MNTRAFLVAAALAATTALAACATQQQEPRMEMDGGHMSMGDMTRMCDMHQTMMAGKSPQEQQVMMEQHIKAMHGDVDPQMVVRHREMMEKNCPGMRRQSTN